MQEDEKIRARAHEIWLEKGMPDGKHALLWELASQSVKEMDRDGESAAVTATSGDGQAGEHINHEPESVA